MLVCGGMVPFLVSAKEIFIFVSKQIYALYKILNELVFINQTHVGETRSRAY